MSNGSCRNWAIQTLRQKCMIVVKAVGCEPSTWLPKVMTAGIRMCVSRIRLQG